MEFVCYARAKRALLLIQGAFVAFRSSKGQLRRSGSSGEAVQSNGSASVDLRGLCHVVSYLFLD